MDRLITEHLIDARIVHIHDRIRQDIVRGRTETVSVLVGGEVWRRTDNRRLLTGIETMLLSDLLNNEVRPWML